MAWFNDSLSDSFTSLKGQITKITKDVLSDDPLSSTSFEGRIKELEELIEKNDFEIKSLKTENARLKESKGFELTEDQIRNLCHLENQLHTIIAERDALNRSIEELDAEHQRELDVIIADRDALKEQISSGSSHNPESCCEGHARVELKSIVLSCDSNEKDTAFLLLKQENERLREELGAKNDKNVNYIDAFHDNVQTQFCTCKNGPSNIDSLRNNLKEKEELLNLNDDAMQNKLHYSTNVDQCLECDSRRKRIEELESARRVSVENNSEDGAGNLLQKLHASESNVSKLEVSMKDLADKLSTLQSENSTLKIKVKNLEEQLSILAKDKVDKSQLIEELSKDNHELTIALQSTHGNLEESNNVISTIRSENLLLNETVVQLKSKLTKLEESNDKSQSIITDRINDELNMIFPVVELTVNDSIDPLQSLKTLRERITQLVAEQQERSNMVTSTLGHEIEKLNGLVNRIRRDFMQSETTVHQTDDFYHATSFNGECELSQSQTDDAKRLKQDIAQMTEVIRMIDHGLTVIHQDKSRVEKEIAVLRSMCNKTESELAKTRKENDELISDNENYLKLYEELKSDMERFNIRKMNLEEENSNLVVEKNKLALQLITLAEDKNLIETKFNELAAESNETFKVKVTDQCFQASEGLSDGEISMSQTDFDDYGRLESEYIGKKENLITFEKNCARLQKTCEELEQKIESLNIINDELSSNLCKKDKENSELADVRSRLQHENSDLKFLVQQLRDALHANDSEIESDAATSDNFSLKLELEQEQERYQTLLSQHEALIETDASRQRELQRLREHLVEVEEHYTAEAVESERAISEYKSKLSNAEEQLRSSSTVYKSANVRSSQHVESLQSQIRLMSLQREDLQAKLSAAEDMVQKHSTAQSSLQMVLEQFQLDKEREFKATADKHEYQLHLSRKRAEELEGELSAITDQLTDAKNGLKAASRLGEQLDRKSQRIRELEALVTLKQNELFDLQSKYNASNQLASGKIDKFLIKNLVIGYITAAQGDRKTQALKILSSVLDLSDEERKRVGVDEHGGWLSSLLQPKAESSGESLSQAFVRFLENESKPQPQLKLIPEGKNEGVASGVRRQPLLTDLVLPTIIPTQISNSSGSVLKEVLRDS